MRFFIHNRLPPAQETFIFKLIFEDSFHFLV